METETYTVRDRAANQAARAITKVIEEQGGKSVSLHTSMHLVRSIHDFLELSGIQGGPPSEVRVVCEQSYDPSLESNNWVDRFLQVTNAAQTRHPHIIVYEGGELVYIRPYLAASERDARDVAAVIELLLDLNL